MASVLEVIQSVASELGLFPVPGVAIGAADNIAKQLTALYTACGQMLVRRRVWRWLLRQHTFNIIEGTPSYPLPADFARPISQTEWDRGAQWPMIGPMTPQQFQFLQSGIISIGPFYKFRLSQSNIEVLPVTTPADPQNPAVVTQAVFNYISNGWVEHVNDQAITEYLYAPKDDIDVAVFDERLMIAAIKMRFYQAKGFDSEAYSADFNTLLEDAIAQDSGAQTLNLAAQAGAYLIGQTNVPIGDWNGQRG